MTVFFGDLDSFVLNLVKGHRTDIIPSASATQPLFANVPYRQVQAYVPLSTSAPCHPLQKFTPSDQEREFFSVG